MRLRTLAIAGAAAIAVLGIAAAIALSRLGSAVVLRDRPAPPAPGATVPPPSPLPPAPAQPSSRPAGAPQGAGAPSGTWSSVPVSARPAQLGIEVAAPVQRGLAAARDQMDACFDRQAQGSGSGAPSEAPPGQGSPILTLDLESRAGTIVVVDTELESLGHSTPDLVECCRRVLRGYVMSAPEAPPGERYRLRYVLQ